MIFSTSSAEVLDHELERNTHIAVIKQLAYAGIGIFLAWISLKFGWEKALKWSPFLFWLFTGLLVLTLIPGIGKVVNGSRRWIGVGSVSFQPSEFVKYILPLFFVYRVHRRENNDYFLFDFLKDMALCAIPIFLIFIEPNNGTALVVAMTLLVLCFLVRIPLKYWALPLLVSAILGGFFALQLPYVTGRLQSYLHPELDIRGKGHQPYQAKIAAGSGKLLGKGVGRSLQKLSYLPEAQNDYIAAIYAEEFGYMGVLGLVFCYMLIAYVGFTIAMMAVDPRALYIASVVTFLIAFQAFLNLGVVSGLLPSTGLNLPFFSQGGTSLLANIFGISLLISCDEV